MTDDGKVKASGINRGEILTENIDCPDLGPDAMETIRKFNLTVGVNVLYLNGDLRVLIRRPEGVDSITTL